MGYVGVVIPLDISLFLESLAVPKRWGTLGKSQDSWGLEKKSFELGVWDGTTPSSSVSLCILRMAASEEPRFSASAFEELLANA
ncbi:hypothetical protein ACLOJK_001930 [Asimina triloba]